jgi:hypothetical protein
MAEIHMTGGHIALIDEADVAKALGFGWHANRKEDGRIYAQARMGARRVFLHRWLLDEPAGLLVDHINGNSLDNRRANLRTCLHHENSHNRKVGPVGLSGFIGVQKHATPGKCRAMLRYNTARLHLGVFDDPEHAARVRDYVARRLLGPFAACNFPAGPPPELSYAAADVLKRYS